MRKVLLALVVTAAAALAVGLPAGADTVGDATPACADIGTGGSVAYNVPATDTDPATRGGATATASFNVNGNVADPDCANVTYSFWVSWQKGDRTFSRVDTSPDFPEFAPSDFVGVFSVHVPAGISTICAAVTTSEGSAIIDRAPDNFTPPSTNCVNVPQNGAPGGGGAW